MLVATGGLACRWLNRRGGAAAVCGERNQRGPGRAGTPALLHRDLRRQRPHLRLLPSGGQQLHDRSRLHRPSVQSATRCSRPSFLDDPLLLRKLGLVTVHADGGQPARACSAACRRLLGIAAHWTPDFGAIGSRSTRAGLVGRRSARRRVRCATFATGAVREHLAKSPARNAGVDFRLPTAQELRGIGEVHALARPPGDEERAGARRVHRCELSVLRSSKRGRRLFNREGVRAVRACVIATAPRSNEGGFNGMFDIGVTQRRDTPVRDCAPAVAADGGFGPMPRRARLSRPGGAVVMDGSTRHP